MPPVSPLTTLRIGLLRQGYHPVPVSNPNPLLSTAGKAPFMKEWQKRCALADEAEVARWTTTRRGDGNTGLLCGELVGLDLDVPVSELADQVARLADAMLGTTPLQRVGKAPKVLRCYRAESPMTKMETPELILDNGTVLQIEVMGVGQQVVAFGTHPGTGKPYTWLQEAPDTLPLADLPVVAEPALRALLTSAEALFRGAGGLTKKEREKAEAEEAAPKPSRKATLGIKSDKDGFFPAVNAAALADIGRWLPAVFPRAEHQSGTGAWRVSSADIGRDLEEDLSIHPEHGGQDFGTRQSCSAIDVVMRHGGAPDAKAAALWLCDQLGKDPATLGWRGRNGASPAGTSASARDEIDAAVDELNARYMVVNEAGKAVVYEPGFDPVLHRRFFVRIAFEDLNRLYLNRLVEVGVDEKGNPVLRNVAHVWLRHARRRQFINGVRFDPSGKDIPGVLNLWEGFAFAPKPGDWSLLRDHVRAVICDDDPVRFNYLMGWMARMLQRPAEQGEVAVVMKGGQGTGKGTLAKALLKIMGQHGMAISTAKHLVGNFNAHLRDAILLFADEAFFAGDKMHVGTLKSLITEPYLTVEAKFQNAVQSPNFLHVMMASNEDWVVPASQDSRRFFVLEVTEAAKSNHEYFGAIWQQMEAGGYEAMLHDLLAYDLTTFNVRAVPTTEGLQQQRKLSLPTTEGWWQDCLARGYVFRSKLGLERVFAEWMPEISTELLFASYTEFAERRHERHPLSRETLGKFMRKMEAQPKRLSPAAVGEHLTDEPNAYGSAQRSAKVVEHSRPPGYVLGALDLARDSFAQVTGLTVEWGEP